METMSRVLNWTIEWLVRVMYCFAPVLGFVVADCGGLMGLVELALGMIFVTLGYCFSLWQKATSWVPNETQEEVLLWPRFFLPASAASCFIGLLILKTHLIAGGTLNTSGGHGPVDLMLQLLSFTLERLGGEQSAQAPDWVWWLLGVVILIVSLIKEIGWLIREPLGDWIFSARTRLEMWVENSPSVQEHQRRLEKRRADKELRKLLDRHNN